MAGEDIFPDKDFIANLNFTNNKAHIYNPYFCNFCKKKSFYIISPLHALTDTQNVLLGYLTICYDLSAINEITADYRNLGDTGEVYLVNKDKVMITESRFIQNASLRQRVDTEPVRKILGSSQEITGIYTDYRGFQTVGVSIYIPEYQWILIAEINKAELFAPLKTLRTVSLTLNVSCCLLVSYIGTLFALSISRPVQKLKYVTDMFSAGKLEERVSLHRDDELGELAHSFNSMADIIVRELHCSKHNMAELIKSELKYRSVINNSSALISIKDLNGRYILINSAYENFIHKKLNEVTGKTIHDVFPGDSADKIELQEKKVLEAKHPLKSEVQIVFNDVQHTFISTTFPLYNAESAMYAIGCISTDITDLKKMQEELLQSKTLQGLGVMATGIAHEFNNILTIIDANIQLLIRQNKGREKLLEELAIIRKSCKDGAEVVRRMNEFTRTSSNPKKMIPVNINDIAENVVIFTKPRWKDMAEGEGLKYEFNREGLKKVPNIMGNPAELREVILNIFMNAFDAMPEGGTISLSTWQSNGNVFLRIADTGIGMSDEVMKKIFDPFFTNKKKGMGLGMSVVYGIVRRHGGTIEIQSQPEKGSIFTMKFPSTAEAEVKVIPLKTTAKDYKDKKKNSHRILVVEDELVIGNIVKNFLSDHGYIVQYVNEGCKAIDLLAKECFDLVLCDIGIPDVSGWEIIKFSETLEKKPKIGIITGFLDITEKYKNEHLQPDFVVTKPYELEDVLTSVRKVFEI
ncbi:MAG: PAS domain-containing protein [Candidatus Kuenenia sp.]|nr:PAS domain-containing protein [Candidatus Kuenenia hertensis]